MRDMVKSVYFVDELALLHAACRPNVSEKIIHCLYEICDEPSDFGDHGIVSFFLF